MDQFVGEIRVFSSIRTPHGWLSCNGQTLPVQAYPDLFIAIGTTFGGDGIQHFKLPDLRGRVVCGAGTGTGLTPRHPGDAFGQSYEVLTADDLPGHSHELYALVPDAETLINKPTQGARLSRTVNQLTYSNQKTPDRNLSDAMLGPVGGGHPHENRQPTLAMNFCIAVDGVMPHS